MEVENTDSLIDFHLLFLSADLLGTASGLPEIEKNELRSPATDAGESTNLLEVEIDGRKVENESVEIENDSRKVENGW